MGQTRTSGAKVGGASLKVGSGGGGGENRWEIRGVHKMGFLYTGRPLGLDRGRGGGWGGGRAWGVGRGFKDERAKGKSWEKGGMGGVWARVFAGGWMGGGGGGGGGCENGGG